jgi:hypothetical protein
MLGSNFLLMEQCFSGRTRDELKRKFKKEENKNPTLVDKYISNQIPFDKSQFMIEEPGKFFSGHCNYNVFIIKFKFSNR